MSRTHKTKPISVKAYQGHVGAIEEHDHSRGPCDLPPLTPDIVSFSRTKTQCTWYPDYNNPISCCGCHLCTQHDERKRNNKRYRQQTRQKTRDWAKDPDSYDEEVIRQKRELW